MKTVAAINNKPKTSGTIVVPAVLKTEFRKLCIIHDLKPADIMKKIMTNWIDQEKKKNGKT